ncbi:hypothetical protein PYW07_004714 [Mythimna separata]|uniref:Uncharacterized protein n=1 Tax=Mythimna separata TaxID=271217 RepID=A0AAD7YZ58_MYTSE|nr:hypothetical protein PYW07_004714 [Mythimna separata]
MDRYVIREPRVGADYPQGNQMMAFSMNAGRNNQMPPENVYYSSVPYTQFPNMPNVPNANYMEVAQMNTPVFGQNMLQGQTQMVTGIDPRYLANYSDNSAQFIVTGQQIQREPNSTPLNTGFGTNYQNSNFGGADRNKAKTFTPQVLTSINSGTGPTKETPKNISSFDTVPKASFQHKQYTQIEQVPQNTVNITPKKPTDNIEMTRKEPQNQALTRMDRLKALHKSGPRAFSGPVEKVLKWHKSLQDIGVFVFYEIVAKCVSVRPGESCAKNLVIRDENGPAMQVVYYEVDFLLPELKIPSTIRVIGRMMAGTCRLQAFSVRPATGDDVATLQRRAAVAAHHVARLCKEYGVNH